MSPKMWIVVSALSAVVLYCGAGAADEHGVEKPVRERSRAPEGPSPLAEAPEFDIEKNYKMQRAGMGLLIAGLAIDIAGIILIEADPWGKVGLSGFISVGVGITLWTIASFLLGFSRPVHGEYTKQKKVVTASVSADGDGLVFGYGSSF